MAIDEALYRDYERAMREHGKAEVVVTLTIFELACLVSLLKLGLRHPSIQRMLRYTPQGSATVDTVRAFVETSVDTLRRVHPAIAAAALHGESTH